MRCTGHCVSCLFAMSATHDFRKCVALASLFAVYASQTAQMRPRAIARNTSCYVCLLCPLRTISANATRLRLSLLVVVPRKFCRKAKDFAKGKSVPNDTDFLGGEGWIRLIAQGKYHLQEQSVYAKQAVLSHFVRCTHDTACLACLLCPLRAISANALRLRLSLIAGSTERWFVRR